MKENMNLEELIGRCLEEISAASRDKYDKDKSERTAALFLEAQMRLSFHIEDIEMKARMSKNEIARVEAEKYFDHKTDNDGKKVTESALTNFVAKDKDVVNVKNDNARFEAELKKYNYLLATLKESHIYFRNLSRNKSWTE